MALPLARGPLSPGQEADPTRAAENDFTDHHLPPKLQQAHCLFGFCPARPAAELAACALSDSAGPPHSAAIKKHNDAFKDQVQLDLCNGANGSSNHVAAAIFKNIILNCSLFELAL